MLKPHPPPYAQKKDDCDNLSFKHKLSNSRSSMSSTATTTTANAGSFTSFFSGSEGSDLTFEPAISKKLSYDDIFASQNDLPDPLNDIDEDLGYPAKSIVDYWKEKEVVFQKSRTFNLGYAEQNQRRYAIDWIRNLGDDLHLRPITIQSAMSILDEAIWSCGLSTRNLRLLCACSLNMAAKYEEAELAMPLISEIALVSGMHLTTSSVTQGELLLAEVLSWNLSRITPMHFLDYYMHWGVMFDGDLCRGISLEERRISRYVKKYIDFFSTLSQQDPLFLNYLPSVLAASVIMATRQVFCISPLWREELVALTCYTEDDIIECEKVLWGCYVRTFPDHCALQLN